MFPYSRVAFTLFCSLTVLDKKNVSIYIHINSCVEKVILCILKLVTVLRLDNKFCNPTAKRTRFYDKSYYCGPPRELNVPLMLSSRVF